MIKVYGIRPVLKELKGITRDIRVTWTLEELKLSYEHIHLDPAKRETQNPEYLKLNPTGKVPTLTDGELTIFESSAICSYLAHKEKKLLPKIDSKEYWIHQQWISYVLTNIEPHTARVFGCDYFYEQNEKTEFARKLATDVLTRMLAPLDDILSHNRYIMGEEFLLTDLLLITCLMYSRHTDLLQSFPNLKRYSNECELRPAYSKACL